MAVHKKTKKSSIRTSSKNLWVLFIAGILVISILVMIHNSIIAPSTTVIPLSKQRPPFNFANEKINLNNQELTFVNGSYSSNDATTGVHTAQFISRSISSSGTRAAAILVNNPGGSGRFYYVVGSTLKDGKETYSEPVLLGDRVKIDSMTVVDPGKYDNGQITVVYFDRSSDEPMAAEPTVKVTMKYAFEDNGNLTSVLH